MCVPVTPGWPPPLSFSSSSSLLLPPPPPEDEGLTLQIVVPDGVGPGVHLGVEVPDVGQVIFVVPEGVAPGAQIQLWYDSSGSLTLLT